MAVQWFRRIDSSSCIVNPYDDMSCGTHAAVLGLKSSQPPWNRASLPSSPPPISGSWSDHLWSTLSDGGLPVAGQQRQLQAMDHAQRCGQPSLSVHLRCWDFLHILPRGEGNIRLHRTTLQPFYHRGNMEREKKHYYLRDLYVARSAGCSCRRYSPAAHTPNGFFVAKFNHRGWNWSLSSIYTVVVCSELLLLW